MSACSSRMSGSEFGPSDWRRESSIREVGKSPRSALVCAPMSHPHGDRSADQKSELIDCQPASATSEVILIQRLVQFKQIIRDLLRPHFTVGEYLQHQAKIFCANDERFRSFLHI